MLIGAGLLERVGAHLRKRLPCKKCAIISDINVAAHFARLVAKSLVAVGSRPTLITIPAGEKSKTLKEAGAICDLMIGAGLDRQSFVIGLGGGVVGDADCCANAVATTWPIKIMTSRKFLFNATSKRSLWRQINTNCASGQTKREL